MLKIVSWISNKLDMRLILQLLQPPAFVAAILTLTISPTDGFYSAV